MFDREKRRQIMIAVKHKGSKVELLVFRYLNARKIYYQKHYKRAAGTPDIALPRKKKAVFIDGDFWHGRTLPALLERKGAEDFWVQKIGKNRERDIVQRKLLEEQGWKVLRVWESDLERKRTQQATLDKIAHFLMDI